MADTLRLILPISFFYLATSAYAQSALEIRVVGREGRALPDTVLTLKHGMIEKHGATGPDGGFRFQGLPAGEYELVAAADGYHTAKAEIVMRPRQPLSAQIEMIERQPLLQSVEVRPADIGLGETSTSRLLTHSELTALPDTMKRDIPTLSLYMFPGATLSHDNFVHVRGNEVSLQEFINGVSFLENPQQQFSAGLTPESFETIDMVSGSFAAEYGNRFGGILDMTTRSGFDVKGHGSLAAGAGSYDTDNAFAEYGGATGKLGYYLSTSGFTSDWYLNPPEPKQLHDFGFGSRGSGQIDYRMANDSLSMFVTGGGTNLELPNLAEDDEVGRNSMRRLRSQTGIFTWQHTFSPRTLLSTSIYERTVDDRLAPTTDLITPFGDGNRTSLSAGVKSDFQHGWRNHTIKAGLDLTRIHLRERFGFDSREDPLPPEDPAPFTFLGTVTGGQASLYVQDHISLSTNLTADIGLRYDHFDLLNRFAQVSPRLAVAYNIPKRRASLHLAYNRLFSPPPLEYVLLANHFGTSAPEPDDRVGSVKPYRQHYVEAGVRHQVSAKANVEVNGFYHRGATPFEYREISVTRLFLPINSARGLSYGVETALELKQLERLGISGRLQYAYQRTFFFGPLSGGFAVGEEIEPGQKFLPAFDEPHSGTAAIFYHHHWRDLNAGWLVRYGSGTAAEDGSVRLADHWTADFTAGLGIWRREKVSARLELNVSNVSGHHYQIAKESEETPIQYAPPRIVAGRIRFTF